MVPIPLPGNPLQWRTLPADVGFMALGPKGLKGVYGVRVLRGFRVLSFGVLGFMALVVLLLSCGAVVVGVFGVRVSG